ncbi:energy-coupling factor transporter ATP-binding protein EcfA2 [Comamonas odontotermitis]|uniref:Energy-coupling factor transporter ATP-binding protein EcfA2 n=1 Tax=Comamonas odontotermitis TaxID=379895 RepID=A0ABR6RHI6_9BURK|nr:AAA family ATPase [Comamonas odontotermitis]MBB6578626.1 energy-coupling factor transporter ATP-binding protein EcfA2 [Comamonas odontotermitis]
MTTSKTNTARIPEVDRLQAAAIAYMEKQKARDAAELTTKPINDDTYEMSTQVSSELTPTPQTEPTPIAAGQPTVTNSTEAADGAANTMRLPVPARQYGLLTRDDVQAEPSAIPLIHCLIGKGQLAMIAGPSGSGKSVFQLHLGAALLNADKVFGHVIPKRSRFLYINLEGELKQRLEAIEQHHEGWSFPAPAAMFLTRPWCLNDKESVEDLAHHVNVSGGVDVIFIDTLNRAIPGSDENLSTDMGMVIAHANLLIKMTGAAVVLTHHTGKAKDRGPRGHSSLYAALDTCLMVDQADSGIRTVELIKTRQGPGGKKYFFNIENIDLGEDDYGLPIVGPALTEVEGTAELEKAASAQSLTPQQQEALVAISLQFQKDFQVEPLKEIGYEDALTAVKTAFASISPKHRSTRAKEAIEALIVAGRLIKTSENMLTMPA